MDPESLRGKKIVLFRTDRLGDLILSFPVVEALKAYLPETQIDIVADPSTASLAGLQRNVSQVFPNVYQGPSGLLALVRALATSGYHTAIHLYPRPILSMATRLARIPERVGTAYRYYSLLYNRRAMIHRKTMATHERELNLKLIQALGIPVDHPVPGLIIPGRARQNIRDFLCRQGSIDPLSHPFVVLHPGSGGSSLNWPVEFYGTLAERFISSGIRVVLTGTETDRTLVEHVHRQTGSETFNLCARLDLKHIAALLSFASLTVSNSTGPLHLADALGKKVIGLYSRHFYASPRRWGPYGQPENVFLPEGSPCDQCTREKCSEYNCMASILPETVLEKANTLLEKECKKVS